MEHVKRDRQRKNRVGGMAGSILIIDDDIAIQTSLSLLFRKEGFTVRVADGPFEAFATTTSGILLVVGFNIRHVVLFNYSCFFNFLSFKM